MKHERKRMLATLAAGALAAWGTIGFTTAGVLAAPVPAETAFRTAAWGDDAPDRLILKDGRVIEGQVLEETANQVRFLVVVAGIKGEQTYSKADILAIERGDPADAAKPTTTPKSGEGPDHPAKPDKAEAANADAPGVYVIDLKGKFGRDIAPTPIRDVVKDASKYKPDYLIVVVDNAWENQAGQELPDFAAAFDQLFLAEDIEPIFTKEIKDIWGYQPKVVVWVKNAMGGAAFLPLNFDTVYFSSKGKMGGIGNLTELFGTTGDAIVREKQFSLRMGHARGMAVRGGYDTKIVEAMARTDYVLSYRIQNGKAVFVEGMPNTELGDHLLTDDGAGDNADDVKALARGEGNDTLTLNAKVAADLGVSKGTADDMDTLLYDLGIDRYHRMIDGRSEQIMNQWDRSLSSAERGLRESWKKFNDTPVQGDYRERTAARATQMRIIREILSTLDRYNEVYKIGLLKLPNGLPNKAALEVMHEQLKQEQMKDRP